MKIRTTMLPDVELDVDAAEFTDLSRQGLLLDDGRPKNLPGSVSLPPDVTNSLSQEAS
jgi:hypothetical protein